MLQLASPPCHAALLTVGAVLCLGLGACAPVAESESVRSDAVANRGDLSSRFHQQVNRYRAKHGKSPLKRHRGLDQLARGHAVYLRQNRGKFKLHGSNVSHYGFKVRSRKARVAYGFGSVGENVAGGHFSVREAVQALADSRNHRHSMLNSWTTTGCAVVAAEDGSLFTVQLFGSLPVSESQRWRDKLAGY